MPKIISAAKWNIFGGNRIQKIILLVIPLFVAAGFFVTHFIFAADGSGTNSVLPTSAVAGSTGNTFTFTFTATETMNSGGISITIPTGFSAPQGTAGVAGYTTVSTAAGKLGQVLDSADSTTGWGHNTSNPTACSGGLTLETSTQHEGAGAVKCVNSNDKNNGRWYKNITAQNWSSYTTIGFWIKVSSGINNGDLNFEYDDSANTASPIESLSLGTGITGNTWTYVSFNFGATTRTSIVSYGFKIKNLSNLADATVWVDNFLLGASSIAPTFVGNTININIISLAAGQTITVTYGSGGGASGVSVPSALGAYAATTKSKISDIGTLTNIATSPTITITAAATSQFTLNDPGNITAGARVGPYTVTRKDQYNNLVTSGAQTVYLYSSSPGASKKFYDAASGGNVITSITIPDGSSSINFWYYDELAGTYTITTSDNASAPDGAAGIADATDSLNS